MKTLTLPLFMLCTCLLVPVSGFTATATFTRQQVIEDLDTLYHALIDTHYKPFAYVSPQVFESKYTAIRRNLNDTSYSLLDTTRHFQQLVATLNNGHTEIDFPAAAYIQYAQAGGRLFPIDIAFENGTARVRANYSNDKSIRIGAEVLSINGRNMSAILADIHPLISAERAYFKNTKLEVYSFPRYYWYAFGEQSQFDIRLQTADKITRHSVSSIAVIEGFETKKDEILDAQMELSFFAQAAYLNPGSFSGDQQAYKDFIDNAFTRINKAAKPNLIIDLRNNSGGNDAFSDYLVSYIADKPFKWHKEFTLRTSALLKADTHRHRDLSQPYWRSIIEHEDGERYEFDFKPHAPAPENQRFSGDVYVLVNRQSHSQASVTAAQIQDYGWATIVGEETGDYPSLYASQFQFTLPHTAIVVKIAKGHIVRVNGSTAEQGVIPDIAIKDYLLDDTDEILSGLLTQLSANPSP
ncbi:S41 family peptidase [Alteromonas gilva]|uniref:S41 family peptidase n=1 Tax=Alteromonas gilva TaxID=2987522 RepID=A0ABT5L4M5_9ALTE|nr:S41 family peptidase [Alteromonas gilva]MDC8831990.1 S41 family peptidase [Alteromonas gilva]